MKKIIALAACALALAASLEAKPKDLVLKVNFEGNEALYTKNGGEKVFLPKKNRSTEGFETFYFDSKGKTYEFGIKAEGTFERDGKTNKISYAYYPSKNAMLLLGQGACIKTPAIKGMALTKVILKNNNMGSGYRTVYISETETTDGEIARLKSPCIESELDGVKALSDTKANTSYYLIPKIGVSNILVAELVLYYSAAK